MQKWQDIRSKAQSGSRDYLPALRRRSMPFLPQPEGRALKTPLTSLWRWPIVPAIGQRATPRELASAKPELRYGVAGSAFLSVRNSHYLYQGAP
jgi:hypothetical protein